MGKSTVAEPVTLAEPFLIRDCALVSLATGKRARFLYELRGELTRIEAASIYYHFWGALLLPRFEEREYGNDFAAWVRHSIHDHVLAERLAALAPTGYSDIESLRHEIIERIDARLDEADYLNLTRASQPFEFICSQIVVFDTGKQLQHPAELAKTMKNLSTSSIFYHFIDARRRTADQADDFSDWLAAFGEQIAPLRDQLAGVDPYFDSLSELRNRLAQLFADHFPETDQ